MIPEKGEGIESVMLELSKLHELDTDYTRVFSSMCTRPHPVAVRAHLLYMESNLGDPGLFPASVEIERRLIGMLGSLAGGEEVRGYITTGGTESNIQAIRAALHMARMQGATPTNVVVPESAHFSFEKVASMLGIELRRAKLDEQMRVDVGSMESLIDEGTAAIVGIAGTTEFGQIDPIEQLSQLALEWGVHLHVDAAFGGFVIPFLHTSMRWNFECKGISSMCIDPHKMGMSTIPCGSLLFRQETLLDGLGVDTPYLTSKRQYSLTGTRTGATAAGAYAVMRHLGRRGYARVVGECMRLTRMLAEEARDMGIEPAIEPVMNVLTLRVPEPREVERALMRRGWYTSITRQPECLRLVIMPHATERAVLQLADDLKDVLVALGVSQSL
ncbi:tyrosine decarboxylase MfnA [Methermicoccus shengliensis]|uniref:Probable L-tyrosine/L-aspartate decarboxylase n=1 Tax=Methermicoccus shengliensis TaxID=660064 RepID=A0A832RW01_9EURY|nr:MAG: L-tyrosine decarboxylase [Euryarchaeota archaeon 55_53]KUK29634.1 MAG: L-tyrosine decarboxylase [Methanosarcinales archeaon 56_1174]MDI3487341.1 tyrosine decarboxylase / aspartate 1-decarboxylase [Methanosarcinales archaeon]MDN5294585.1 tyrosine decarboxylase / aspartate 1-decarboxylase [Methanosarcinales archaeon]HIH69293.1 tyrosine decarboxylase MfnA [Methermicoccus shengliensis]